MVTTFSFFFHLEYLCYSNVWKQDSRTLTPVYRLTSMCYTASALKLLHATQLNWRTSQYENPHYTSETAASARSVCVSLSTFIQLGTRHVSANM